MARRRQGVLASIEPMEARVMLDGSPTLTVVLSSATMSELWAGNGTPATVQRSNADTSQSLTVNLQSSDTTAATVQATVVIPAGATSASFIVHPADDTLLDGPQSVQITASSPGFVYASSTSSVAGLDTTFGTNGYASVPQAWALSNVYPDLVIQPNGSIVTLSQTPDSTNSWTLVRRTASGAVDAGFGTSGKVTTTFSSVSGAGVSPTSVTLQSDGKILAVGHVAGGVTIWNDLLVARYNTNGSLDTTFGSGGILRVERATHTGINDVAVLSGGSILLAGSEGSGTFLAKITPNGSLDATFGTGGVVLTAPPAGYSSAWLKSLVIRSDGSFLGAGSAVPTSSSSLNFLAVRYLPDGSLDASYDFDGMQQVDTNPVAVSSGVLTSSALQADGKLVLVGYDLVSSTANENWVVSRLNTDGSLDSSFSGDGLTMLALSGSADYARDVVLQPDGRIVVMGEAFVSGTGHDLAVARFNTDGSLDTTFDGDGRLVLPNWSGTIWEQIWAGELNAEGQLVFFAGYINDMRIGRLNMNTPTPPRDLLTVTDWELLSVSITPSSVAENAGPAAVTGTVTRGNVGDLSSDLTVALTSSDTSELTVPATVVIPAGQTAATFAIDAVDDTVTDGSQSVTISASAAGYILLSDSLSVTDDDTNVAPVAAALNASVNEDTVLNGQVSASDAEGEPLTYSMFANPSHGQVTMNSDGSFAYTPAVNFAGSDSFQFRAFDGRAYSNTATVSVVVHPVNDAPVAVADSYTLNEDQVLITSPASQPVKRLQMISDAGDYIGQGRTYDLTPAVGTFSATTSQNRNLITVHYQSLTNGSDYWTLSFESAGFNTPLAVGTYLGATRYPFNAEGTPGLSVTGQGRGSNTLTGSFTIEALSFNPGGSVRTFAASFEQHSEGSAPALRGTVQFNNLPPAPGGVLVNDSDAEGGTLVATYIWGPEHGTVNLNLDGSFTYTPHANYHGPDSFIYVANDGLVDSPAAVVSLIVNSVPDAPTILDQSLSVYENSWDGTVVGNVVASDGDAGQALTYAITSSTLPGAFAIDAVTGEITKVDGFQLDHEQADSVTLTVEVTDNDSPALSSSGDVTVTIIDVNDAPRIVTSALSVDENSANGTSAGFVDAIEQDVGQTLTWELTYDTSGGAFAINPATGELTVINGSVLDFEAGYGITLGVGVIDNANPALFDWRLIQVTLNDVNEAPVILPRTYSVDENSHDGQWVGSVYAQDPDAGQAVTYAITASSLPGAFVIDPVAGVILAAQGSLLNHETTPTVTLTVTVTDDGVPAQSASSEVTIFINDVNESPTVAAGAFTINENSPIGSVVGTVNAADVDDGQELVYFIASSSLEGAFAINSATGQITVANADLLNHEAVSSATLWVAVEDYGTYPLAAQNMVTITIANVNDAPVLADQSYSVREYLNQGSLVGTLAATDEDPGQTVSYSLDATSLPGAFMIVPNDGRILVWNAFLLDYETANSVTLTIRATDSGNPASSTTATVTIAINDVNESPMMVDQSFSVAENSANGTVVGTVVATDVDQGQALTYEIFSSPVPGAFAINAATGQITVSNGSLLDFESRTSIELALRATDNGTPALATFAPITIQITNVNEAPVIPNKTFSLAENSANGVAVGTVTASDPDAGQSRTFAITGGNTNNVFAINATTGAVTVNNSAALDFEATPSFALTVTVTDNGVPARSSSATVTVNLTNVNDAPAVTAATFNINENSANGAAVGTVAATDQDAGQTRTFAITGGNTNYAFSINATTGALRVNNSAALNFETSPTFALTITATDNGSPSRSGSATVTVNLLNVNEAPVLPSQSLAVKTKSKAGTVVGTVTSSDPDVGQTRTYAIVSGNGSSNDAFAIDATTGVITVKTASRVKSSGVFNLIVRVTDNGSPVLSSTGTVKITVNSSGRV